MGVGASDRLHRAREIDAQLRALTAELDQLVGVIDRERDWAGDRHRSVKGYLRAELNWSDSQIADHLRAVRLAADVPEVGEALAAATVGVAQARLFGRARANPRCGRQLAEFATELLEHSRALPFNDFRLVIERWEQLADADGSHSAASNGAILCGKHNRDKNHGYRVRRDTDGHWHTYRPDGSEIAPTDERNPPTIRAG